MDIGRRGYTTTAKLFRDSDETVTIRWFPVPRENGTLPYPSGITSLDWHTDPHTHTGIGEVYAEPRPYAPSPGMPVFGGHICGAEDQHRNGQLREDGLPPTEYWPSGLPKCCDPFRRESSGGIGVGKMPVNVSSGGLGLGGGGVRRGTGGVGLGGAAVVIREELRTASGGVGIGADSARRATGGIGVGGAARYLTDPSEYASGGVGIGGAARYLTDPSEYASGGVGIGGAATNSTTLPPGATCDTALSLDQTGHTYTFDGGQQAAWFLLDVATFGTYLVTLTYSPGDTVVTWYQGGTCSNLQIETTTSANVARSEFLLGGGGTYLKYNGTAPGVTYTIRLDPQ